MGLARKVKRYEDTFVAFEFGLDGPRNDSGSVVGSPGFFEPLWSPRVVATE